MPNKDFEDDLLKIFGAELISAEWKTNPQEAIAQILAAISARVPEKKKKATVGDWVEIDGYKAHDWGFNKAIDEFNKNLGLGDQK